MTQAVQIFNNPEYGDVRIVDSNGEIFFVGRDVATALSYSNPQKALRDHVPDKYKRTERIVHPQGGAQDTILINEAGFYKLVMRSKLPNAEKFSDWVCEEVLPTIRKHGVYATNDFLLKSIANPAYAIGVLTALKEAQDQAAALKVKNAELQPKADFYDRFLNSDETMPITYIAKMYGKGGAWLNKLLEGLKIQRNVGGRWVLNYKYTNEGYTRAVTTQLASGKIVTHTEWTNRGRILIYNRLKEINIVPEREREENQLRLFEEARS